MLAALLIFNYNDQASREQWSLQHSRDHQEIRQAIQAQKGVNLTDWQLSPIAWQDWDSFALRHQNTHNDMNGVLGLNGTDITSVNFEKPEAAYEWNYEHFAE